MSVHPILVDSRPGYLGKKSRTPSLLLLPIGRDTLVAHLTAQLREVTPYQPVVIPPADAHEEYAAQIAAGAPGVRVLADARSVADLLATLEPSDTLLMVDPRTFPAEGFDPSLLLDLPGADPRWAVHYVAVGGAGDETREYADIDAEGRVRRVRRYYDGVTWPFISGVAASVLPVSALLGERLDELSLTSLRGRLAARGVPGHDVPLPAVAVDLRDEAGLLALLERHVRRTVAAQSEKGPVFVGSGQRVHPSARLVGPVILHPEVVVEERAIVMGPTVIGAGARIGRDAIVAQSLVASGCVVPPAARIHHRTVFDEVAANPSAQTARRRRAGDLVRLAQQETAEEEMPAPRSRYMTVKRVIETAVAAGILLLLSPLMLLIALAVALDSKGPIFYGHEREGLRGRRFRCLKFRSMQVGAQALERELHAQSLVDGPQFKLKKDPRVTRVGNLLRLTNLDELPQLINVVRGEMALIGPRPSPFNENQLCVPWRQGRLSVRPGITGLWQVCRHDRSEGDFHQWIEYDLLYVRHMSLLLDLRILLATALSGGGQRPVSIAWVLPAAARPEPSPSRSAA